MSNIKIAILFIINLILDLAIFPRFNIYGASPTVAIALIVLLSMTAKSEKIVYYSIAMGLMFDIVFSNIFGIRALSYYLIAYYTFKKRKDKQLDFNYGIVALVLGTIFNEIYIYIVNFIKAGSVNLTSDIIYFLQYMIVELIFSIIIYSVFYTIISRLITNENKKFFY